jgi:peptide alpha-N-acetyltransferase
METLNLSLIFSARNGAIGPIGEWKLKDCIAVHQLLGTVLVDQYAAFSKYNCNNFMLPELYSIGLP